MITLKKVRFANFFAVGKHAIEINLLKNDRTLIIGKNGSGKTTMINAICFALFGVPYSDINKPLVVNSINKKETLVELDFDVGTVPYKIKRGIKPNVFEIYQEGKLIPKLDRSLDYQKYLEENILCLNFNAFKQIVVIGKSGFVPFMRLKTDERRRMIESILDLTVFSTMNSLLKQKMEVLKEQIDKNQKELDRVELDIAYSTKELKLIHENNLRIQERAKQKFDENRGQIQAYQEKINKIEEATTKLLTNMVDSSKYVKTKNSFNEKILELNMNINSKIRYLKSLDNDSCPTCQQPIDERFKSNAIDEANSNISDMERVRADYTDKITKIDQVLEKLSEKQTQINKLNSTKSILLDRISNLEASMEVPNEEIRDTKDVDDAIALSISKKSAFEKEKNRLYELKEIYTISNVLLKDSGIKSKIIATYIPLLNKILNEYLDLLNFYVQFEIDENFNEVIKSRYRDDFSYENFSEGEKNRIDLALLFAWRDIAKTKNRINVNLLVLDEVFDSSLDSDGLNDLNKIMKSLGDTNIFLISHNLEVMENFQNVIKFEKKGNFSTMKYLA